MKKEAHATFLTDPHEKRSTFRPTNILVYEWVGGKHVCVDLTGVSPLVGPRIRGFTMEQTVLKTISNRMVKHEKT